MEHSNIVIKANIDLQTIHDQSFGKKMQDILSQKQNQEASSLEKKFKFVHQNNMKFDNKLKQILESQKQKSFFEANITSYGKKEPKRNRQRSLMQDQIIQQQFDQYNQIDYIKNYQQSMRKLIFYQQENIKLKQLLEKKEQLLEISSISKTSSRIKIKEPIPSQHSDSSQRSNNFRRNVSKSRNSSNQSFESYENRENIDQSNLIKDTQAKSNKKFQIKRRYKTESDADSQDSKQSTQSQQKRGWKNHLNPDYFGNFEKEQRKIEYDLKYSKKMRESTHLQSNQNPILTQKPFLARKMQSEKFQQDETKIDEKNMTQQKIFKKINHQRLSSNSMRHSKMNQLPIKLSLKMKSTQAKILR